MEMNEYQREAERTLSYNYTDQRSGLTLGALGLAGESGEAVDLLKKHLFHDQPLDTDKLRKELGDVLWYLAAIATSAGLSLDDVARANVTKLRARFPNGFTPEASVAKADERGGA
jgi:NTP pyrophosphatase (non-canonical NTP hydrolase)